ncbi:hypothetical protein JXB02_00445 [Candidatus Woesearchaeota archaeon]|nr:hypothetical protein [Candidatus Woesearchaeota archaeon]
MKNLHVRFTRYVKTAKRELGNHTLNVPVLYQTLSGYQKVARGFMREHGMVEGKGFTDLGVQLDKFLRATADIQQYITKGLFWDNINKIADWLERAESALKAAAEIAELEKKELD